MVEFAETYLLLLRGQFSHASSVRYKRASSAVSMTRADVPKISCSPLPKVIASPQGPEDHKHELDIALRYQ